MTEMLVKQPFPHITDKIITLNVSQCNLTSLLIINVRLCPLLRELFASFNAISSLDELWGMDTLEVVDLEGNVIAEESDLLVLGTLPNLKELTLVGNPVWKEGLKHVYFPQVHILDDMLRADIPIKTPEGGRVQEDSLAVCSSNSAPVRPKTPARGNVFQTSNRPQTPLKSNVFLSQGKPITPIKRPTTPVQSATHRSTSLTRRLIGNINEMIRPTTPARRVNLFGDQGRDSNQINLHNMVRRSATPTNHTSGRTQDHHATLPLIRPMTPFQSNGFAARLIPPKELLTVSVISTMREHASSIPRPETPTKSTPDDLTRPVSSNSTRSGTTPAECRMRINALLSHIPKRSTMR